MAQALTGHLDDARQGARRAVELATDLDDEALLARSLQRMSYVEYQAGNIAEAERNAREARASRIAWERGFTSSARKARYTVRRSACATITMRRYGTRNRSQSAISWPLHKG
jgi:hypothetical protein